MCDCMKDEMKAGKMEAKMAMWKMRDEMLKSMDEKELRAFVTGYLMAESMLLKKLGSKGSCSCGCGCGYGQGCNCNAESCNCEHK